MMETVPGLVVLLVLLTSGESLRVWRSLRRDYRALEERVCELEAQRAAILKLED